MDRQIPIYFDSVIIDSPFQGISDSDPNIGRLKVGVFTKYGNRNGSYITEEVANQLIASATSGSTPVVGFFDPESESWASHTGPTLANAYGYVEQFLGWEPFQDTDGVTRDYAVFSVILFTEYFEEAKKILGQHQSMELDPNSIDGEWVRINEIEYFVYSAAKIQGLCIIGKHEPCFSVSSFFTKNSSIFNVEDDSDQSQYEVFSSLLDKLKNRIEEIQNFNKGGEQSMENDNKEVVEEVISEPQVEFENVETEIIKEEKNDEPAAEFESAIVVEEEKNETEPEQEVEQELPEEPSEFEKLQEQFNILSAQYDGLLNEFQTAEENHKIEIEKLQNENVALQNTIQNYELQVKEIEENKKNSLIEKYEKLLTEEEITNVRSKAADLTYDKLESELAITFANHAIAEEDTKKVLIPEPKSQFALFMEKYRINK